MVCIVSLLYYYVNKLQGKKNKERTSIFTMTMVNIFVRM